MNDLTCLKLCFVSKLLESQDLHLKVKRHSITFYEREIKHVPFSHQEELTEISLFEIKNLPQYCN